ncbi:hypothetical protein EYZ11_007806 [Aspergillus tanneri]|uniref:Major facilitator superfamily (MFS) profile domain-containing protein n=1 Tax=Aspergillus tanneri TaxID=1220188 RepID=A0A4S3JC10_9EURO|nr:hypothetical protein EYZ11_007806 [Aspergillus tanneri]
MFFTLLAISFFFRIDINIRLGLVAPFSIVVFVFFYGIGAGPVPFTFSAEVFPLAFRGLGLLVLFVPILTDALQPHGHSNLLFLFTGLNAIAFVLVFFLVSNGSVSYFQSLTEY